MKKIILFAATMLVAFNAFAQTSDEMKAERAALKSELTSKDAEKKASNIEKKVETMAPLGGDTKAFIDAMLLEIPEILRDSVAVPFQRLMEGKQTRNINKPDKVDLNTLDGLVEALSPALSIALTTNDILADYKADLINSENGEIDLSKYQEHSADYLAIVPMLVYAGKLSAKGAEQLGGIMGDISKLNPLRAGAMIKTSKWVVEAVDVMTYKLNETRKLLDNLTKSLKAEKK